MKSRGLLNSGAKLTFNFFWLAILKGNYHEQK
jgi:hypothetical protein